MKKALLLSFGVLFSFITYAQTGGRYIEPGTTTNDSIIFVNNYPGQIYDSTTYPHLTKSGYGYLTGMNADGYIGYAENYQPDYTGDSAWHLIGTYSIWTGTFQTGTSKIVNIQAWDVDTSYIEPYGTSFSDSVSGLPGNSLASVSVNIANLNIGSGMNTTYSDQPVFTYFSGPVKITAPFFVGYEGPFTGSTPYVFGADGDTIALRSTTQGQVVGGTETSYYLKGHGASAYKMHHSRNAMELSASMGGGWRDLYNDATNQTNVNLAIVPIIMPYDATAVHGINNRNLTFYGNYPNPATTSTNIKYALTEQSDVTVQIMDLSGRVVNVISKPAQTTGEHIVTVNTANMAAGSYIYIVKTSSGAAMASKMTIVK